MNEASKTNTSHFIHMVFFWLKDTSAEEILSFKRRVTDFLDEIAEIDRYHVGTPADTSRPVIERGYSVSLVVEFNNKAAQDIYQVHESHQNFVADSSHRWEKVLIFDADH